ncbi:cobalamin biosynthesis protein CobD/CbiB [Pedobacter antarcticus]|uniref:cobalamin biosynthesis protein CobD/CbiB n=1 Tax=Pedobacter antarcticus TaxID=34086 RepID=UPI00088E460A|nr:CobD/CbiB family cobalamin biosynthesis protein [Pedobacter antarcticus]SDL78606.1 adenosylcobinamide-phosphate synthase [Pedobacter antarcticus]
MEGFIRVFLPLLAGYLLDFAIGDLPSAYRPELFFKRAINSVLNWMNCGTMRLLKGAMLVVISTGFVFIVTTLIWSYLLEFAVPAYLLLSTLMIYWSLGSNKLIQDGDAAFNKNKEGNDSSAYTRHETVISMSSGLSKRVVSPVFYYCLGGIPLMLSSQLIHYLDDRIGYKTTEFEDFGKAAAWSDDVINFIPSRITAVLILLISRNSAAWKYMMNRGHLHASPNTGYPLMAISGVIGIDLLLPVSEVKLSRVHYAYIRSLHYAVILVLVVAIGIYYFNW